jgi:hypothetical protein
MEEEIGKERMRERDRETERERETLRNREVEKQRELRSKILEYLSRRDSMCKCKDWFYMGVWKVST